MQTDAVARAERLAQFLALDPDNTVLMTDLACNWHAAGEHQRALELPGQVMRRWGSPRNC